MNSNMNITITDVFNGIARQQLPALQTILEKAKAYAEENSIDHETLLATRLHPDMHPLSWQINTTVELALRGMARLSGQEPTELNLGQSSFDELIKEIDSIRNKFAESVSKAGFVDLDLMIEIPVGPENTMSFSAKDYLLKFTLPNLYFHLTTCYDILRMAGVELGKRDFMGPIA